MKKLLLLLALIAASTPAQSKPVWWTAAEKAASEAWQRSYQCDCEQAFAIDLRDESIIVRIFQVGTGTDGERYASHVTITPNTVAVFHTHPSNPQPSKHDREVAARHPHVEFYVVYFGILNKITP